MTFAFSSLLLLPLYSDAAEKIRKLSKRAVKGSCKLMEEDGRKKDFYELIEAVLDKEGLSKQTEKFLKGFRFPCKPRRRRRRREEENEKRVVDESLPSPKLVALVARSFREFAAKNHHGEREDVAAAAVATLLDAIKKHRYVSASAASYFSTLASFIKEPFAERIERLEASGSHQEHLFERRGAESLFE